ncbi:MAG: hypothetical protein OXT07_04710 [bacterium]|nr:hypothetical protein [bacterium]MDE0215563.1 hypothetical protein [bacterium]
MAVNHSGYSNLALPEGGEHPKVFLGRAFLAAAWLGESRGAGICRLE